MHQLLDGFRSLSRSDKVLGGIAAAFSVWVLIFVYVANKVFDTFGGTPQIQEIRRPSSMDESAQKFKETWDSIDRALSKSMKDSEARMEKISRERQAHFRRVSEGFAKTQRAFEQEVKKRLSTPLEPIKMRPLSPVQVEWIPQEHWNQSTGRSARQKSSNVPGQKDANMATFNTQNNSNR